MMGFICKLRWLAWEYGRGNFVFEKICGNHSDTPDQIIFNALLMQKGR
jgi:hypothetical protein